MFEQVLMMGLSFKEIFLVCILFLLVSFLCVFLCSLYINRDNIDFYKLIVRDSGRISKVGVSFVFIITLIVYQAVTSSEISFYLVELLGVIFAAEVGTKFVDNKLGDKNIRNIKNSLSEVDEKRKTHSARNIEDIDFDNL